MASCKTATPPRSSAFALSRLYNDMNDEDAFGIFGIFGFGGGLGNMNKVELDTQFSTVVGYGK